MKDLQEFEAKFGRLLPMSIVAKRLKTSSSAAYEFVKTGQLKAIRIGVKKGLRVPEKEVERFIKDRGIDFFLYE